MKRFSRFQARVLIACFSCYFCAYIGRLNMSAALSSIIDFMGVSAADGGTLQTVFAVTYAAGQLVWGTLADRFQPRKMLVAGLIGSAVMNATFSAMNSFTAVMIAWTLNGVFQSMLWTPIVRLMAQTFDETNRKSASFVMSFTLVAGHFFAWLIAGLMARMFSWRMSFAVPAGVLAAAAVGAYFALPQGERTKRAGRDSEGGASLFTLLKSGLIFVLIGCVANGFVRDSVISWGPTILGSQKDSLLFTLLIPVINLFGILLGAYLVRHVKSSIRALVGLMMGAVALLSLGTYAFGSIGIAVLALLLGLISSVLYGSNPMLTTLIPLEYDRFGRAGMVAGLIDCCIYLGSSLSGRLVGRIHDLTNSWDSIYLVWIAAAIIGCASIMLPSFFKKKQA